MNVKKVIKEFFVNNALDTKILQILEVVTMLAQEEINVKSVRASRS